MDFYAPHEKVLINKMIDLAEGSQEFCPPLLFLFGLVFLCLPFGVGFFGALCPLCSFGGFGGLFSPLFLLKKI